MLKVVNELHVVVSGARTPVGDVLVWFRVAAQDACRAALPAVNMGATANVAFCTRQY
jgi:hypothetical protein